MIVLAKHLSYCNGGSHNPQLHSGHSHDMMQGLASIDGSTRLGLGSTQMLSQEANVVWPQQTHMQGWGREGRDGS